MSKIIDYANFSDLEDQIDALYEVYDRVEYIRECGPNRAELFCE